jgi:RNA polymerase-binding transcription factor DksA
MTTTDLYKKALEVLLKEVTVELSDIAVHNQVTDDWEIQLPESSEPDEDVQADASENADEKVAELAELETRYRSIMRALEKIAAGTYGICEISGESIEEDRLAVNPAARTCKAHMEAEYGLPQS